jgi:hypothetical protein
VQRRKDKNWLRGFDYIQDEAKSHLGEGEGCTGILQMQWLSFQKRRGQRKQETPTIHYTCHQQRMSLNNAGIWVPDTIKSPHHLLNEAGNASLVWLVVFPQEFISPVCCPPPDPRSAPFQNASRDTHFGKSN